MKKLSIKEMKKIAYEIISKELGNYTNMEVYIFPVTNFEYYTSYIEKFIKFYIDNVVSNLNKEKLLKLIKRPFSNAMANTQQFAYSEEDSKTEFIVFICILMNKIKEYKQPLIELLRACYHEARHCIQLTFDNYSYAYFLQYVEGILINNSYTDYHKTHNSYSIEIDANLYGIFKTEEFLKNKYPDIYELEFETIKYYENDYKLDYMLFDAVNQINKTFDIVNKKKLKINDEIPIFNIFMRDDNSFKSIEDMIKNPDFEKLDKRIVYTVLSSNSFLKNIYMPKLSNEELTILNEALQYTYTVYINQFKFILKNLADKTVNINYLLEIKEQLISKIKNMNEYITLLKVAKDKKQYQYEFIKIRLKEKNVKIL